MFDPRNFPNRLGEGANVYLTSAELAAVASILGKLPTPAEYQKYASAIDKKSADLYRYLNFDKLPNFTKTASSVELSPEIQKFAASLKK